MDIVTLSRRAAGLGLLATLVTGCGPADDTGVDVADLRGWVLGTPAEKIDFTLPTTDGTPFDFRRDTEGFVTLLFFGFTNCPDVCPLHMSGLGAVLDKLAPDVAAGIKVVFVTTDPERDTPDRLGRWLKAFHRDFVGLVGTQEQIDAIQTDIGLTPAFRERWPDGGYGMAHAAQVIVFTTDNRAHLVYPSGTRQVDWAHDLPKLVLEGPPRAGPESEG